MIFPFSRTVDVLRRVLMLGSVHANEMPEGILAHVGLAVWEMPRRPRGERSAGYLNALANAPPGVYRAHLRPSTLNDPEVVDENDYANLERALFETDRHALPIDDGRRFAADYAQGNSIALQNLIFSPLGARQTVGGGAEIAVHDYRQDLHAILARAKENRLAVWGNIGFANNVNFWTGEHTLNTVYALEAPPSRNPHANDLQLGSSRKLVVRSTTVGTRAPWLLKFPQHLLDPTHPDVVRLVLAHVRQMARDWGDRIRFVMPAEGSVGRQPLGCRVEDIGFGCGACAPVTNFAPHVREAFVEWLRYHYEDSLEALRERWGAECWGVDLTSFAVAAAVAVDTCFLPAAVEDYQRYLLFLWQEVAQAHYHAAKAERPRGWYALLSFGVTGIEQSWLRSDGPTSGDWYSSETRYREHAKLPSNVLRRIAGAAMLSGRPPAFVITSPPHVRHPLPEVRGPDLYFPMARELSQSGIDRLFFDALGAGTLHIGYLRESLFGFQDEVGTRGRVLDTIRKVRENGDSHFRLMAPYARLFVSFDDPEEMGQGKRPTAAQRFGHELVRKLYGTQVPHGWFSDPRVMRRLHADEVLRRSIALFSFRNGMHRAHPNLPGTSLLVAIADMFASPTATGTAVVTVLDSVFRADLMRLLPPGWSRIRNTPYGHDIVRWPGSRTELLVFEDSGFHPARAARQVVEYLVSSTALVADPLSPVRITEKPTKDPRTLQTNLVTDGANVLVAIANMSDVTTTVTLDIDPDWARRIGHRFLREGPREFLLPPWQVTFRRLLIDPGRLPVGEASAILADLARELGTLGSQGFSVDHGMAAIDIAERLLGTREWGRALAAIAAIGRMLFVAVDRDNGAGEFAVRAAGVWDGSRARIVPTPRGSIQGLHVLHGHEETPTASLRSGVGRLPYHDAINPEWNPEALRFVPPSGNPATEPMEIHVRDDDTGVVATALVP